MEDTKSPASMWLDRIKRAEQHEADWRERARKVIKRHRDEKERRGTRLNILWSNTETLRSALLTRLPKPDVRRRFSDRDPVGKQASILIERGIEYAVDCHDAFGSLSLALDDMLLPGRGVVRVVYEAETLEEEQTEGEEMIPGTIKSQKAYLEYVPWADLRIQPSCRYWDEVQWIAFRVTLSPEKLKARFPDLKGKSLTDADDEREGDRARDDKEDRPVDVWEVWDKESRQRLYVTSGFAQVLEAVEDPLKLEGFFPIPRPLYAISSPDTLVPNPLYLQYQDQALELDKVSDRIAKAVDAIKRRGVYDGSVQELARLKNAGDDVFVPVDNWARLQEKGGLASVMQAEDFSATVSALQQLVDNRAALVETIYQITGISDIVRGMQAPGETATATRLKGQFGGLRLRKMQDEVARFVRDLYRMLGEVISEHFEPQQLVSMAGLEADMQDQQKAQVLVQALQLLRQDHLRQYRVDIETDTTAFEDADAEKSARIEFVQAMTQFGQAWLPVASQSPQMAKLAGEVLGFATRGFKSARMLEEAIDEAMVSVAEAAAQQQGQQQPQDPLVQIEQTRVQVEQIKAQTQQALAQMKAQGEQARLQIEKIKAQAQMQKMQSDTNVDQQDMQLKLQIAQLEAQTRASELELKRQEVELKRLEVAMKGFDSQVNAKVKMAQARTQAVKPVAFGGPAKTYNGVRG